MEPENYVICDKLVSALDISRHSFAFMKLPAGSRLHRVNPEKSLLILQLSGSIRNVSNSSKARLVSIDTLYLLPKFAPVFGTVEQDSCVLLCRIPDGFEKADRPYLMQLSSELPDDFRYEFNTLPVKPLLNDFVRMLVKAVAEGLDSPEYLRMKRRELFYYIRNCYGRKDVAAFMYPLIGGKSISFKDFVLSNYMMFNDVGSFAEAANMSQSTFARHFRNAFGTSKGVRPVLGRVPGNPS